jgi:hypothetical protein
MVTVATIRSRRPRDFDLDQGGGHCGAELPVRWRMRVAGQSIAALIEIKAPIAAPAIGFGRILRASKIVR